LKKRKLLTEETAIAEETEYMYKPMINQSKKYSNVQANYRQDADILRNIEEKSLSR
jgi:hypothetical protein